MTDPTGELQRIKGIGAVTARRLVDAGIDSGAAIVKAGELGLKEIPGINPRSIPMIIEQAKALVPPGQEPVAPSPVDAAADMKGHIEELRGAIQEIAAEARERFPDELSGKAGHKLTRNMVAGLDALYAIEELLDKRPKRSRKALAKARKKIEGLADGDLITIRKGIKKARKALERVLD